MKYPKCKTNISDKSIEYCPKCGTRVRKIETIQKVIVKKETSKMNVIIISVLVLIIIIGGGIFFKQQFGTKMIDSTYSCSFIERETQSLSGQILGGKEGTVEVWCDKTCKGLNMVYTKKY